MRFEYPRRFGFGQLAALVAKSKFAKWPDYGMAKTGHIGVQEHGFKVEFKNIKIKVLS